MGPTPYDPDLYEAEQEVRKQGRLTGLRPRDPNKGKAPRTVKEAEELDFRGEQCQEGGGEIGVGREGPQQGQRGGDGEPVGVRTCAGCLHGCKGSTATSNAGRFLLWGQRRQQKA